MAGHTQPLTTPDPHVVERIAVVLVGLPADVREQVLAKVDGPSSHLLREQLERYRAAPPPPHILEEVLGELERQMANVLARLSEPSSPAAKADAPPADAPPPAANSIPAPPKPAKRRPAPPSAGDDDISDEDLIAQLQTWDVAQLAEVLSSETPGVVATVLNCLETGRAAALLNRLPRVLAGQALGRMLSPLRTELLSAILKPLFDKSRRIRSDPLLQLDRLGPDVRLEKMIELLRLQHPSHRTKIFAQLEEADAATAEKVKDKLYTIHDLLLLEDSAVQKLLKDVTADILAPALMGADEAVREKLFNNMSKRARENLLEEMQLSKGTGGAKVAEAQQALLHELVRLDTEGSLAWVAPTS